MSYQGMTEPLSYFPKTSLACIEAGFSRGNWVVDEEESLNKMADAFNDSYMASDEGNNAYTSRIWPDWNDELAHQTRAIAVKVLQAARLAAKESSDLE